MENKNNISLSKMDRKLPFSVPENYFENFAVQLDEQTTIKPVVRFKIVRSWMYVAAVFVGVLIVSQVAYSSFKINKINNQESYDAYVLSQVDELAVMDYEEINENFE